MLSYTTVKPPKKLSRSDFLVVLGKYKHLLCYRENRIKLLPKAIFL
jgi:hypothetical protein